MVLQDLKKSLMHSLLGKYALYVFQMASLMVLARLISPENFGIVAAVQVIGLFFHTIGTAGLTSAVVYQDEVTHRMRDGIFTFTFIFGIALSLILVVSAPYIFAWFSFESGIFLFYLLSVYSCFSALSMMPLASLLKDKKFIQVSQAEMMSELLGFTLCLCYFFLEGDGLIGLGLRFVSIPVFRFVFYYVLSLKTTIGRPKFGRDIRQVQYLYSYAKFQILFNMVNYCSRNLDNLLLAKYFGAATLGVYEKTYQIMRYPLQLFTFAITPALQPVLTQYKDQPDEVYSAFLKVASRLAIVGIFSSSVLYLCSDEVIYILFGEQWLAAAPLLQIMALSVPVQMIMSATGGVFQAFGRMKELFICGVFSSTVSVSAIVYGVYIRDLTVLCWVLVLAFHVNYIQCLWMLRRCIFRTGLHGFLLVSGIIMLGFVAIFFENEVFHVESIWRSILEIVKVSTLSGSICLMLLMMLRKHNV